MAAPEARTPGSITSSRNFGDAHVFSETWRAVDDHPCLLSSLHHGVGGSRRVKVLVHQRVVKRPPAEAPRHLDRFAMMSALHAVNNSSKRRSRSPSASRLLPVPVSAERSHERLGDGDLPGGVHLQAGSVAPRRRAFRCRPALLGRRQAIRRRMATTRLARIPRPMGHSRSCPVLPSSRLTHFPLRCRASISVNFD